MDVSNDLVTRFCPPGLDFQPTSEDLCARPPSFTNKEAHSRVSSGDVLIYLLLAFGFGCLKFIGVFASRLARPLTTKQEN